MRLQEETASGPTEAINSEDNILKRLKRCLATCGPVLFTNDTFALADRVPSDSSSCSLCELGSCMWSRSSCTCRRVSPFLSYTHQVPASPSALLPPASNLRAFEFVSFVCLRVAALNPLRRSSRLCSSLLRLHHPRTGCLGQKTVCGHLGLSCRCAGAEEWAQPWRWKKRKRRLKEDRKKNAAPSRTLSRRGKGTGCCLYGGRAALVS